MKTHNLLVTRFLYLLNLLLVLASCSNETNQNVTTQEATVYIVGTENNGTRREARMWTENTSSNLHTTFFNQNISYTNAGAIFVKGDDIYVFGSYYTTFFDNPILNYGGVIWKNGVARNTGSYLTSITEIHNYFPMFATDTDFYNVVNEYNPYTGIRAPYLYKNTETIGTPLTDPNVIQHAAASSMFITSNNQYVLINQYTNSNANVKLWKNGQITSITDGSRNEVGNSMYVSNDDVYIAGTDYAIRTIAKVWKNGVPTTLTDGSRDAYAKSVFIKNNDIYVAGSEKSDNGVYKAKYWKNGTAFSLTDGTRSAWANSISVFGSDIYVVGAELNENNKQVAKIWKNGIAFSLTDGTYDAEAKSIFVK